ncbi:MAG: hypothetical protein ACREPQ_14335 [Rhodanobacter sp.]
MTTSANNWASIIAAIDARAAYLLAEVRLGGERPDVDHFEYWSHPYFRDARRLAGISAIMAINPSRVPTLLADMELLAVEFWAVIQEKRDKEWSEAVQHRQSVKASMANRGQWRALGYPSPEEMVASLRAGACVTVEQHTISFDRELQTTWFTNPYGIDGVLCCQPTTAALSAFLLEMGHGKTYGPTPHDEVAAYG